MADTKLNLHGISYKSTLGPSSRNLALQRTFVLEQNRRRREGNDDSHLWINLILPPVWPDKLIFFTKFWQLQQCKIAKVGYFFQIQHVTSKIAQRIFRNFAKSRPNTIKLIFQHPNCHKIAARFWCMILVFTCNFALSIWSYPKATYIADVNVYCFELT